jgi:hypothetical protein
MTSQTGSNTDATLMDLCAEVLANEAELRPLCDLPPGPDARAKEEALADQYRRLMDRIRRIPASTSAGLRAKAMAVRTKVLFDIDGRPMCDDADFCSLIDDVLELTV